jgi:hypothetical protein
MSVGDSPRDVPIVDSPREVEGWWAERPAHVKDWGVSVFVVAAADYDRLQAEVAALKELLREYGHHKGLCDSKWPGGTCDCGFEAALARGGQG